MVKTAAKYLKYLYFVEGASKHTLISYANDLNQLLGRCFVEKISISFTNSNPLFAITPNSSVKLDPQFAGLKLQNVDGLRGLIQATLSGWSKHALTTRNRKAACLKGYFKWAYTENYISTDLSDKIFCPKVPRKIPNFLSVDEALNLINTLKKAVKDPQSSRFIEYNRDYTLILTLYSAGLRVSEACNLQWKHVDFNKNTLLVLGKGGKQRIVTPAKICFTQLKRQKSLLPSESIYIFNKAPLNTRTAYSIVRRWGARANLIKPLSPHALRHSFATHLLTSGAGLRALQELLGHSSLVATEKYTHITTDDLQKTLNSHHPLEKT